jgi:UDP-3-O-[3-hydroxymyristoyl] glucosamine N-acyltransferase
MHQKKETSLIELSKEINAVVTGDESFIVNDISEPKSADKQSIVYLADKKHLEQVNNSLAEAVLLSKDFDQSLVKDKHLLVSDDLPLSFIALLNYFYFQDKISSSTENNPSISDSAEISDDVQIGAFVCIRDHSKIGKSTVIGSNVSIGSNVHIGANCIIHPNVSIYTGTHIGDHVIIHSGTVIGADGFGFVQKDGKNIKVPQIGNVVIEDHVEIGANSNIDCATIDSTLIKKGAKIDDQVMIAHNVEIGENTIIASQSGVSGSSKIGNNCILAGKVGVADHAVIEDNVIVGAKTGVTSRVVKSEEKMIFGTPARPILKAKRIEAIIGKLPELYNDVTELKKKINGE